MGVDARNRGEYYRRDKFRIPGRLLRRLCNQQTDAAQFLVGENHPLAAVVIFDMTSRRLRIAAQVRLWHSEKHRGAMLLHTILSISIHNAAQILMSVGEQMGNQTCELNKSLYFNGKERC